LSLEELQALVDDASYDFAMGDADAALAKLEEATRRDPELFEAWLSLAEVHLSGRRLDAALAAAERAMGIRPKDLLANATLSRIWMERGDKPKAEHFGAQARMQSWKEELERPAADDAGGLH